MVADASTGGRERFQISLLGLVDKITGGRRLAAGTAAESLLDLLLEEKIALGPDKPSSPKETEEPVY